MINKWLFSLLLTFSAACSSSDMSPITAEQSSEFVLLLEVDESLLSDGVVMLVSKLQNNTDQSLVFLPWNTPFDNSMTGGFLTVSDISDARLPAEMMYLGPVVKRSAPRPEDYVTIAPGESLDNRLDITNRYKFCSGRDYIIDFANDIFNKQYETVDANVSQASFSSGSHLMKCEPK